MIDCANCGDDTTFDDGISRRYGEFTFLFCDENCAEGWDKKEDFEMKHFGGRNG